MRWSFGFSLQTDESESVKLPHCRYDGESFHCRGYVDGFNARTPQVRALYHFERIEGRDEHACELTEDGHSLHCILIFGGNLLSQVRGTTDNLVVIIEFAQDL
jgi:hypothetical protein